MEMFLALVLALAVVGVLAYRATHRHTPAKRTH